MAQGEGNLGHLLGARATPSSLFPRSHHSHDFHRNSSSWDTLLRNSSPFHNSIILLVDVICFHPSINTFLLLFHSQSALLSCTILIFTQVPSFAYHNSMYWDQIYWQVGYPCFLDSRAGWFAIDTIHTMRQREVEVPSGQNRHMANTSCSPAGDTNQTTRNQ